MIQLGMSDGSKKIEYDFEKWERRKDQLYSSFESLMTANKDFIEDTKSLLREKLSTEQLSMLREAKKAGQLTDKYLSIIKKSIK
jgi:hypothetical protein